MHKPHLFYWDPTMFFRHSMQGMGATKNAHFHARFRRVVRIDVIDE